MARRTQYWLAAILLADIPAFGDDGATFLNISPTAEQMGRGNVDVMALGTEAAYYNPAGLSGGLLRTNLSLTSAQVGQDERLSAAAFTTTVSPEFGTVGVSLITLNHGALTSRDDTGAQTGSFGATDMAAGVSWAHQFTATTGGITAKFIRQQIEKFSATGFAVDLGAQSHIPDLALPLRLGFSIRNLGTKMKFINESYDLPLSVSAGASVKLVSPVTVQLGVSRRYYAHKTSLPVGLEINLGPMISVRSGYTNLLELVRPRPGSHGAASLLAPFCFGLGLRAFKGIRMDYAFTPANDALDANHRLTLSIGWGDKNKSSKTRTRSYQTTRSEDEAEFFYGLGTTVLPR